MSDRAWSLEDGWTFEDGWILMAVFLGSADRSSELAEILAAADGINHALPTRRELCDSLTRLVQAGVILEQEDRFEIHPDHVESIEKAYQGRGGLFTSADKGRRWLERADLEVRADLPPVEISDDRLDAAHRAYGKIVRSARKG